MFATFAVCVCTKYIWKSRPKHMQTTEETQAICGPYTQIEANQTGLRGLSAGTAQRALEKAKVLTEFLVI